MKRFFFCILFFPSLLLADNPVSLGNPPETAQKIIVNPQTSDAQIQERLEKILLAMEWFIDPVVEVREGVVFLFGKTKNAEFRDWAGNLAKNTQYVVGVVNKIEVVETTPFWDMSALTHVLHAHWRWFIHSLPSIFIGIMILFIAAIISWLANKAIYFFLKNRLRRSPLLQKVISRMVGILIFLLGVYLIFEVAGLTGIAVTIISGTGLLGIILGIAFRDITENFLSSIVLSIYHPFLNGDLVEIAGVTGYVQQLTMRVTVLMALDGNQVQIPNSLVYKNNIRNFTSNPKRRIEFTVSIGKENSITEAQQIALKVLDNHKALLKSPDPLVVVDSLSKSAINLIIYAWIDTTQHDFISVKSSIIRLIKDGFQKENISIPGEICEVILQKELSVQLLKDRTSSANKDDNKKESKARFTESELGKKSQAENIKKQGQQSRKQEGGKNLLDSKEEPPK